MDKANHIAVELQRNHRRAHAVDLITNSLPRSRGASPARNVRSTRAMFQGNEPSSVNKSSPDVVRRNTERFRSNSPIIGADGKVTIEGEDKLREVCESVEQQSRNISKPSLVTAFSRPTIETNQVNNELEIPTIRTLAAHKGRTYTADIDRSAGIRNFPGHVSVFSKVTDESDRNANATVEVRENTRTVGRRQRERQAGGRAKQIQAKQDLNTPIPIKQHNPYTPTYVQPIIPATGGVKGVSDLDGYNTHQNVVSSSINVPAEVLNKRSARNHVRRPPARASKNRMSSSTSGDSSNSETPSPSPSVQKLRLDFNESKQIPASSDNEPEIQTSRQTRRQRARARNRNVQRTSHSHLPDYVQTTTVRSRKTSDPMTQSSRTQQSSQDERTSINKNSEVSSSYPRSTNFTPHVSHRSRTKNRMQYYMETDDKYATLPADFRPPDIPSISVTNGQSKANVSSSPQTSQLAGNFNQNDPQARGALMISHSQTSAALEDSEKERYDEQQNSANQSQDSKHSLSNQSNKVTSNRVDRLGIAAGRKGVQAKTSQLLPQNKTKQVEDLRSFFNSETVPKTGFGQVYNNNNRKQQQRLKTGQLKVNSTDINQNEVEQVIHSQPMLKATKLSEDFWPRDEATQKLLNSRHAYSNSEPERNVNSGSGALNEMSGHNTLTDRDIHVDGRRHSQTADKAALNNDSELQHSPKETNLNDPQYSADMKASDRASTNEHKHRQGQKSDLMVSNLTPHTSTETLQASIRNGDLQEARGALSRSQSVDETVQKNSAKLTSPQWSYDDPDSKLKAFDNFIDNAENVRRSGLNADRSDVSFKGSSEPYQINEADLNEIANMRNISIRGTPLYVSPNYESQKLQHNAPSIPTSNEMQGYTNIDSNAPNDRNIMHTTASQSGLSDGNNISSSISKWIRKSSVVSESTALPRNTNILNNNNISMESGDIDEGCFTEEDTVVKPSMTSAFKQLDDFTQARSSQNEDRNEVNTCATPNSRRRRKFSAGQNGSDTSNNSNSSESARSLSDPIPSRKKSLTEEENPSVNFLVPLKSSTAEPSTNNSESDLSVYSENASLPDDYDNNAQNIINEPTAIKKVLAEFGTKNSTKVMKKKSFSDPNANAVLTAGLIGKGNTELDVASLYNSSSEPALSEQVDELGELNEFRRYQNARSNSDVVSRTWDKRNNTSGIGAVTQSIEELSQSLRRDHHLAMSPRSSRRDLIVKKRKRAGITKTYKDAEATNQLSPGSKSSPESNLVSPTVRAETSPAENLLQQEEEQFNKIFESMSCNITDSPPTAKNPVVHSRSCSEPAVGDKIDKLVQKVNERGRRAGIVQAPSLNDVLLHDTTDQKTKLAKQLSNSVDRILPATLPRSASSHGLDYQMSKTWSKLDMRQYVVKNLLDTEDSYVKSLRILYESYLTPLKRPENHGVCEPRLVDEIFFQIPQILQHHEKFYANVRDCMDNWDSEKAKMGDVFIQSFNKDKLLESYTSYIKNYLNAREAVNIAIEAKSAFKLFLEQCQRENKDKQGLSDLMIKPVQRIPRYELIIKELLKHTPENHPDHKSLQIAQRELHALSVQMNKGEKEAETADRHARLLHEIDQLIEGNSDIGGPSKRKFLHQDVCVELKSGNKKDRSLWLFNDLLMCTSAKKGRTASLRRSSMNLFSMTTDRVMVDFTSKYKFMWKFPLDDIELLKGSTGPNQQALEKQMQQLRCDHDILKQIEEVAGKINCNHVILDDAVKDLIIQTNQKIAEKQAITMHGLTPPGRLEVGISTPDGMKNFQFEFPSEDNKTQFEVLFWNSKKSFTSQKCRWDPAFMKAIPISKTRNGMQFSCAAPNIETSPGVREVWVCNTDGYVGQICFLTLEPEPLQKQCITVCSAKICCITQVPTWDRRLVPTTTLLNDISKAPLAQLHDRRRSSSNSNPAHHIIPWDDSDDSDEDNTSPFSTASNYSVSPYSTNNSTSNFDEEIILPIMSPLLPPSPLMFRQFGWSDRKTSNGNLASSSSDLSSTAGGDANGNEIGSNGRIPQNSFMHALLGSGAFKKDSDGSTLHGSLEDLLSDGSSMKNNAESPQATANKILPNDGSMWLGTEDGKIKVYSTAETLRTNKHNVLLHHNASVQCILHHNGQVFVALNNGDLIIYFRNLKTGQWDFDNNKTIPLGTSPHPITKMVVVGDKELWCGCQNQIMILDMKTRNVKSFFSVSQDNKRQIYCMVCCGYGVWVALDKRSQIKLYHTVTHYLITDIDVSNPVSKMLASSDAIIRQHKAACLRITSLLVCKDLLWVGTSAGVVLTMTLPSITASTTSLPLPIIPQGLAYGHTGHVRFLTSVDILDKETPPARGRRMSTKRRLSSASNSSQSRTNTLVISGGDGYEDFRMNSASEAAGREDSTNHLLVWRV